MIWFRSNAATRLGRLNAATRLGRLNAAQFGRAAAGGTALSDGPDKATENSVALANGRRRRGLFAGLILVAALSTTSGIAATVPDFDALTLDQAVAQTQRHNARMELSASRVDDARARLRALEAILYPRLGAAFTLAPMFSVDGDAISGTQRRFKSLSDWGPYTRLELSLVQVVHTFGRHEAAVKAANAAIEVEQAREREAALALSRETRRMYYLALLGRSLGPALKKAATAVDKAASRANELYAAGTGEITQSDLMRLRFATNELARARLDQESGERAAMDGLRNLMGLAHERPLSLAERRLQRPASGEDNDETPKARKKQLAALLRQAAEQRPEWAQAESGVKASLALEEAAALAGRPTLFVAAGVRHDWAPTRDDAVNPYHYDPYNKLVGGVGVGLRFDLQPGAVTAGHQRAAAQTRRVRALQLLAETGIPLQVVRAANDRWRHQERAALAHDSVRATRKWMGFAIAGFMTGSQSAKELLEGIAGYLRAKEGYYRSAGDYWLANAEVHFATGTR